MHLLQPWQIVDGSFNSSDGRDFSQLGASIGQNTRLTKLVIKLSDDIALDVTDRGFFEGIKLNSSIHELVLICDGQNTVDGVGQKLLMDYQEKKQSYTSTYL